MINKIATKISGIDIDKDYYYDLILEYRRNIVDKKFYYIDLKMPDNGPYSDQYADQYCLHKFKDWRKECRLAIKQYYKEKDDK